MKWNIFDNSQENPLLTRIEKLLLIFLVVYQFYLLYSRKQIPISIPETDLSDKEVNKMIEKYFCRVENHNGRRSTGYFVDDEKKSLLTTYHLLDEQDHHKIHSLIYISVMLLSAKMLDAVSEIKGASGSETRYSSLFERVSKFLNEIRVKDRIDLKLVQNKKLYIYSEQEDHMESKVFFPELKHDPDHQKKMNIVRNYKKFDILPVVIKDSISVSELKFGKSFQVLPFSEESPQIGEKVYFGGYPLGADQYSFSTGMISSILKMGNYETIVVIEGPIVPGNSGSPVFIQRHRQLYVIGMIYTLVANVSQEIREIYDNILKKENSNESLSDSDSDNEESFKNVENHIIKALFENMSTGRGRAILLTDFNEIFNEDSKSEGLPLADFPAMTKRGSMSMSSVNSFYQLLEINKNQLTTKNFIEYIVSYGGKLTWQSIPEHKQVSGLKNDILYDQKNTFQFESKQLRHFTFPALQNDDEKPHYEKAIRIMYTYAIKIGKKQLYDNQIRYLDWDRASIVQGRLFSTDFKSHHIVEGTQAIAADTCERILRERNVNDNTVLRGDEIFDEIDTEIKESTEYFELAHKKSCETAISLGEVVEKILFMSLTTFRMTSFHKEEKKNKNPKNKGNKGFNFAFSECTGSFIYGVIKQGNRFVVHHFESTYPDFKKSKMALFQQKQGMFKNSKGIASQRSYFYTTKCLMP